MAEEEVEYEEGYDLKKVGALILGIILAVIVATMFLGLINIEIPEITIPEITIPEIQTEKIQTERADNQTMPRPIQATDNENPNVIKTEYEKYIEFGLTVDDIVDIQNMPCTSFEEGMTSPNPKYTEIFEQRRSEC